MTWALDLPENMDDNELYEFIKNHRNACTCEGCREYAERIGGTL